jgi:hypothetical protein
MLTTLSLSLLAGSGMAFLRRLGRSGWLSASAADTEPGPWRRLAAATRLLLGLLVVAGVGALLWPIQKVDGPPGVSLLPGIWLALGAGAVALAFWGLAVAPSTWPSALFFCWVLVELFAASRPLEYNNPNPESVYTASRPVIDALEADPRPERLLSVAATGYQPSDADQLVAGYQRLLGPNGVLATWINTKYKETLNPNLPMVYSLPTVDGYDGGVLPLRRYVELKTLFLPPDQNQPDGLLRDQLRGIPSPSVLRLLGVKYLLDDTISDVTRDGVYYDLAGSVTLGPGQLTRFNQIAALSSPGPSGTGPAAVGPVTAVGVVSALQGAADVLDGTPVLQVTLGGDAGPLWQGVLRAGSDTAEGAYTGAVRHRQPTPLGPAGAGGNASATYLARIPAASVAGVRWVEVQDVPTAAGQSARVSGITLIGQNGASWPVTVAGGDTLRLVHHSDVKLYLNQWALPRTYLVGSAEVAETPAAVLAAMGRPGRDPQDSAILERDPGPLPPARTPLRQQLRDLRDAVKAWLGVLNDPRAGTAPAGQALPAVPASSKDGLGTSTIVDETSERLVVRVEAGQPALLVVRDTYFPGWAATVDGAPAPLWRADYLFRAVPVPAGSHTVELRFQSAALERGAIVSVVAFFLTVLLAFFPLPRRAERALAPSPEAGPEW